MSIEQAIYTHTKVRRDTRSTGFGFYSLTAGMEQLLETDRRLSAAATDFLAPRNSEIWWEQEEQDAAKRDELESERIAEHHPVTFAYRLFGTEEKRLAALSFGKNLGRDLSPLTRDGNILVNTLVADPAKLDCYPYEYCGSTALFLDCGRDFFLNAGDEPAPDLPNPTEIPRGSAPDEDEVAEFLAEDDRLPQLRSMLGALMKINDGGRLKRLMICDRKENIIYWIAALSLVYPRETAKALTFGTYSFLGGNPDDFSPVYPDVMVCGVYTPTVNGDPASRRATNYDPQKEQANPETALFDFEQGVFYEAEDEHPYFGVFIESAFETDMRLLHGYRDFIAENTTCRTLGSGYAEGYGYYTITRLKNEYSMRYIADAVSFAKKHMNAEAMRQLLDIAFSCGFGSEEADRLFGGVLEAAGIAADEGYISHEELAESSAGCLLNKFRSEDTMRDSYFALKDQLTSALGRQGASLEKAFIGGLTADELNAFCTAPCKRWRLAELAGMISKILTRSGEPVSFESGRLERILLRLGRRLVISEKNDRCGLMEALLDGLGGEQGVKYLCAVFRSFADKPEIRSELTGALTGLFLKARNESLSELISLAEREGVLEQTIAQVTELASEKLGAEECAELFASLLKAADGRLDGCFDSFMNALRGFGGERPLPENIYSLFLFARDAEKLAEADIGSLARDYFAAAAEGFGRYSIDDETGQRLLEMTAAAPDVSGILASDPELASAEAMIFARVFAEEPDISAMYPTPDLLPFIDFGDMTEAERYECVREAGNAFCRRSIMLHSALAVEYKYFLDTEDRRGDKVAADIFAAWAEELAVIRPPECLKLIGQTIAMSSPFMRGGLLLGNILYERGITPDEIKPYVFDKECLTYIGSAVALSQLEKLMDDVTAVYNSRAVKSPFGKIRSKLGGSKKPKK